MEYLDNSFEKIPAPLPQVVLDAKSDLDIILEELRVMRNDESLSSDARKSELQRLRDRRFKAKMNLSSVIALTFYENHAGFSDVVSYAKSVKLNYEGESERTYEELVSRFKQGEDILLNGLSYSIHHSQGVIESDGILIPVSDQFLPVIRPAIHVPVTVSGVTDHVVVPIHSRSNGELTTPNVVLGVQDIATFLSRNQRTY